jgi:Domain of unknown function (DUF4260)
LVAIGWWQDESLIVALGLVWLAHIGLDRLIGYGLECGDHFQHNVARHAGLHATQTNSPHAYR